MTTAAPDYDEHADADASDDGRGDAEVTGQPVDSVLTYGLVWLALLGLLGLTLGANAVLGGGTVGLVTGLGIAALKAALVVWFFLHLRHHHGLTRIAAVFALVWLGLLMTFTLADYATRVPAPTGTSPGGTTGLSAPPGG